MNENKIGLLRMEMFLDNNENSKLGLDISSTYVFDEMINDAEANKELDVFVAKIHDTIKEFLLKIDDKIENKSNKGVVENV